MLVSRTAATVGFIDTWTRSVRERHQQELFRYSEPIDKLLSGLSQHRWLMSVGRCAMLRKDLQRAAIVDAHYLHLGIIRASGVCGALFPEEGYERYCDAEAGYRLDRAAFESGGSIGKESLI